jgi:pimeloyl-ACP methyl ester carboxylesterase
MQAFGAALIGLVAASLVFTFALLRWAEARYPPVGQRVALEAGRLHVVETAPASAERAAVVLVHGGSGNFADPHVALAEPLSELGFRVFAVDRPGHGYSDRLGGRSAASPLRQAQWIREAVERLGVREAIVVVHSLSGVLGLAMALDAPQFTRGLVLLAPVSHPWKGGVTWYHPVSAAPVLGVLFRWLIVPLAGLATMRGAIREVFAPNPVPLNYIDRTRLPLLFRPAQFRANAEDFLDLHAATVALSPRYAEISAPTAIVMGAADSLVSADIHARQCARDIPNATLRLLDGVGHSPHFSAREAVIEAVLEVDRRAVAPSQSALQETA